VPIVVSCSSCGSQLRAPDTLAGKRVKCPRCSHEFTVQVAPETSDLPTAVPANDPLPPETIQTAPPRIVQETPEAYPPVAGEAGMQYLRAYQSIFENPNWTTNLLLGSVVSLIPAIGGILLNGYCFDCTEDLYKTRGQRYPDFNFSRFVEYLLRGLWPFIISLCIGMPVGMVLGVVNFTIVFAFPGLVGLAFILFLGFTVIVLEMLVLTPALMYAGLRQELDVSGTYRFVRDFLPRAWVELLLSELFLMVTGMLVMMVGVLMCCIGILPAVVVVSLARAHILYQLYELYLQRGGSQIPFKSPAS
jgi:hypothetical protein